MGRVTCQIIVRPCTGQPQSQTRITNATYARVYTVGLIAKVKLTGFSSMSFLSVQSDSFLAALHKIFSLLL